LRIRYFLALVFQKIRKNLRNLFNRILIGIEIELFFGQKYA